MCWFRVDSEQTLISTLWPTFAILTKIQISMSGFSEPTTYFCLESTNAIRNKRMENNATHLSGVVFLPSIASTALLRGIVECEGKKGKLEGKNPPQLFLKMEI